MAKKEKKGKKSQSSGEAAAALRDAVERTFQAGAGGAGVAQKRAGELFDDLTAAMTRLREAVDERHVLERLEQIRDEVQGLAGRVAALERKDVDGRRVVRRRVGDVRRPPRHRRPVDRFHDGPQGLDGAQATARKTHGAQVHGRADPAAPTGTRKTGTARSSTTATKRAASKSTGGSTAKKPATRPQDDHDPQARPRRTRRTSGGSGSSSSS